MAEAQTQDPPSQPSPAIADLAPPGDDSSVSGLVSSLTNLQRQKVQTDTKLSNQFDAQSDRDRAVRNHAFQLEGVAASELPKPWDADKEHKKWESNPIEGFGSAGGLFAMVASAFTKAPMENAINGMAGAITSIQQGNEAGYARAYDAFKTNVKLADQRFKTQHELYQDALSLGTADAAASAAKFHNAATRFGDSQMLMLAEHGMIKEIYELQASRAQAHEQMIKAADATDLHTVQKAAVDAIKKSPPNTGDPVRDKMMLAAQIQRVYDGGGKYGSAEQEAVGAFMTKNFDKSPQEIADGLAEIHQSFSVKAPNIQGYQEARAAAMEAGGGTISPDEDAKLLQQFGLTQRPAGGGAGTAGAHTQNLELERRSKQYTQENIDKGMDPEKAKTEAFDRAQKEIAASKAVISGNRKDDQEARFGKATLMEETIDHVEEMLKKHNAIAGLGGVVTRPAEAVGNIFGSNQTDRKQFERWINEMQEWAPQVLNDRSGRPLSTEASKIQTIIAGLKIGDTTANTARAYRELRPLLKKLKEQLRERHSGTGPLSGGDGKTPASAEPAATPKKPWDNDPVVGGTGPRSESSDSPPISGAKKAPDGNWYVDDPQRPGKYLQVQVG